MPKWANKSHKFYESGAYFGEHGEILFLDYKLEKLAVLKKKSTFLRDNK